MNSDVIYKLIRSLDWSLARLAVELRVSEITIRRWLRIGEIPDGPAVVVIKRLMRRADRPKKKLQSA